MKNSLSVHVKLGSKKVHRVVTFETAARSLCCSELTCFDISQSCKWQLSVTISTSSSFIRTRPFVLEPKCFFFKPRDLFLSALEQLSFDRLDCFFFLFCMGLFYIGLFIAGTE